MSDLLARLKGGLIASCQPVDQGPMDRPEIVAAMAEAAIQGGAAGLRIEGVENLRAARRVTDVPIIGIVKSDSPKTPVRITVSADQARDLVAAGADIVAYDATPRPRQDDRDTVLRAILGTGALAMADCATEADGRHAASSGAAILGTTLSGYTDETQRSDDSPDYPLISRFRQLGLFVMAEGRFDTPERAAAAIRAGADAVTVGSVLTRLEVVTGRFARAIEASAAPLSGFAVDLGGTKTAAARIADGRVVAEARAPTEGSADPEALLHQIARLLAELGYHRGDRLGVAVTGRVDRLGTWHAVNRNTLNQVEAVPLAALVSARIGPAKVLNDAAAATLAEHRLGAGRGHENFAFVTVSTGVGGGLILNGRLHQSANGLAGHLGFAASRGAALCGSGRMGTVESAASGWAIAKAAGSRAPDARAVFQHAAEGAPWAETLVDASAHAISDLIADLVAIAGVTHVALGGSIGLAEGYLARVQAHQTTLPPLFQAEIALAECGAAGPLLGALSSTEAT